MKPTAVTGAVLLTLLAVGCATPADVKTAIKKQADAYAELGSALGDFKQRYDAINTQLFVLTEESRLRLEALAMVHALAGREVSALAGTPPTVAQTSADDVRAAAADLDTIPPTRVELLNAYDRSLKLLERAVRDGRQNAETGIARTRATLKDVDTAQENALKEIRGLIVIHGAVAEYLQIDLTPDAQALRDAIGALKGLAK